MRPEGWHPPVALSAAEQVVVQRIKRAKLFRFLRRKRHELFDAAFQEEWGTLSMESDRGAVPVLPAKLALVTLLQAYTGASDDEAIEALVMDRRWQLVLDCLDAEHPPFGKGTLVRFRQRLIAHDLDRRLIERTVELATRDEGREVSLRHLRAALDSRPLWGAGRVEDTDNLLGHALRKAVGVLARQQGRELAAVATELGADVIAGSSLKAALDLDWDDPEQQARALVVVLAAVEACERQLAPDGAPPGVTAALAVAHQVETQDVVRTDDGQPALRQGVAPERRISVEDADMRHGRKSRSLLVDGYKRHVLHDLDRTLIVAVGVTSANVPEAIVTDQITGDLAHQGFPLDELDIDRAYLSSTLVRERPPELQISCKAWPVRNGPDGHVPKTAFTLDLGSRHDPLSQRDDPPLPAWRRRPVPRQFLHAVSAARPLHQQRPRPQRHDPPRRTLAPGTARAPADPSRTRQAARTHRHRAHPGPHRPVAGARCTVHRSAQEPLRSAPHRRCP